jgi:hypothetical protein
MKRIIIIISVAVVLAVITAYVFSKSTPTSTHHALIKADIDPRGIHGDEYSKQRQAEVEQIISTLTALLDDVGLSDVTDSNVQLNTKSFGNEKSDRTLRFKGQSTGSKNTIPLEALIIFDTERYEKFSIHLSEGYSRNPSERLAELYTKLDQTMDQVKGDKYISQLW